MKTKSSNRESILFPMLECWNPINKTATIAADVDKSRVLCHISLKTLVARFGAKKDQPMRCVAENRNAIRTAAKKIIEKKSYEEDGSIRIRSGDL